MVMGRGQPSNADSLGGSILPQRGDWWPGDIFGGIIPVLQGWLVAWVGHQAVAQC